MKKKRYGVQIDQDLYAEMERHRLINRVDGSENWIATLVMGGFLAHSDGAGLSKKEKSAMVTRSLAKLARVSRYFRIPQKVSEIIEDSRLRIVPTPSPSSWLEYLVVLSIQEYLSVNGVPCQAGVDILLGRVSAYIRRVEGGNDGKS